jgi:serine/threonine-protein kinase PknK
MIDRDPFKTQRDLGPAVVAELTAAGFDDAEEIGRGGFGIVYRCTQVVLERTVAVKVLTADLDENRERFLREQRAMGVLTGHPNIVGVLQVGETQGGYPYLVMQHHRRGSLEARIRRHGPLALAEVLRLGVKMVGALETAHRVGILHRDIKPGNILFTDYGEPALSDFGIAHVTGGFKTATGTFTGSPAYTAPELLSGDPPSWASDVYGLGATLFSALTGHAAFERHSGEQVMAQFLRIAAESAPDPRESGAPDDVSAVVEKAMARDPHDRPSALALGERLQQVQAHHGFPAAEMALQGEAGTDSPAQQVSAAVGSHRTLSHLPMELTSFIGRRAELAELKTLLTTSRLVTVAGIGGIGKTRLALRAAAEVTGDFPDGVRLVELGELRDGSALVDVVAAGLGLRDQSATPLRDVLVGWVSSRKLLLVLDNCEQVVDGTAELAETLLRACPELRILATSREALGVDGESVLRISPLAFPSPDAESGLADYDAVELFAERAAAAVPGFELTADNKVTVSRLCARLDGLPLAIELAAARLRAMSPEQLLERLGDRYTLLTRGSRRAPSRQRTLGWSIAWSYDLCTPAEQQLWGRLSVFAGSFELEAAEYICGDRLTPEELLDLLSSLVDKSILIRSESKGAVRFRLLETLRDYGREQFKQTGDDTEMRRRHLAWYRQLVRDAATDWFSSRQLDWNHRLECELPNLREALEFAISGAGREGLEMVSDLHQFWLSRGMLREGRRCLDRALSADPREPTFERFKALNDAIDFAELQGESEVGTALATEARALAKQIDDPRAHSMVAFIDGWVALTRGDFDRARTSLEAAVDSDITTPLKADALMLLGWTYELSGDPATALTWHQKALALADSHGESVYRSYALRAIAIMQWRQGEPDRAKQTLRDSIRLSHLANDPRNAAACLEALAWIAGEQHHPRRAVALMEAAERLGHATGSSAAVIPHRLPHLTVFHEECERRAREALDAVEFDAAREKGRSLRFDDAVASALSDDAESGAN